MKIIKISDEAVRPVDYFDGLVMQKVEIIDQQQEPVENTFGPESYFVGTDHRVDVKVILGGYIPIMDSFSPEKLISDYKSLIEERDSNFPDAISEIIGVVEEKLRLKTDLTISVKVNNPSISSFEIKAGENILINDFTFVLSLEFFEPGDPSVVNQGWSKAWNASRRPI